MSIAGAANAYLDSNNASSHSVLAKALRDDFLTPLLGEVAEWPNVTDSKSVVPERVPGVRIPPSPPLGAAQLTIWRSQKRDENCSTEGANTTGAGAPKVIA